MKLYKNSLISCTLTVNHSLILVLTVFLALPSLAITDNREQINASQFVIPKKEKHILSSKITGRSYEIHVHLPIRKKDESEYFPVLYATDAHGGSFYSDMADRLQLVGDLPRFISVGIGNQVENYSQAMNLRRPDLTPTQVEEFPPNEMPIEGLIQLPKGARTGQAAEFLRFIREELIPFINSRYNTIPGDKGYIGHSFGGLFGLYVMFNKPETFNRYIILSPAVWWDNEIVLKQAQAFAQSGRQLNAKVFLGVGSKDYPIMVSGTSKVNTFLRQSHIDGLEIITHTFPDETHLSIIATSYFRALQSVYGSADCVPYLDLEKSNMSHLKDKEC